MDPRWPKMGPRWPKVGQDVFKMAPRRAKTGQDGFKMAEVGIRKLKLASEKRVVEQRA